MAFVKKTWKDRIAEFPTRRRLTKSNGDSELVTVAREEGTLSQEGDAFSAENMNDLESRVDNAISEINSNLEKLQIGTFIKQKVDYPNVFSLSQGQSTSIDFTLPTVEGYKPFVIESIHLGTVLCSVGSFYLLNDTTAQIMLTNTGNQGTVSVRPSISVLYQATVS